MPSSSSGCNTPTARSRFFARSLPVTCREFADAIGDYLAGDLATPERMSFESHQLVCANSCWYLVQYDRSITLAREAFQDVAAARANELPESLVASILSARCRLINTRRVPG